MRLHDADGMNMVDLVGYWNMNHGAFGSVCRDAAAAEQNYYNEMESDANIWYRGVYQGYLDNVRTLLSKYVNARQADLVLVENASSAVNAILRSLADTLPFNKGDKIMHMNVLAPSFLPLHHITSHVIPLFPRDDNR
jgi:selenocysteine lyase/cysteine desulfurase